MILDDTATDICALLLEGSPKGQMLIKRVNVDQIIPERFSQKNTFYLSRTILYAITYNKKQPYLT